MTRFEADLKGMNGKYWQDDAKNEIAKIQADVDGGKIIVDHEGVARNCIGRVLHADLVEVLLYTNCEFDKDRTAEVREEETREAIRNYKAQIDIEGARAAFGEGSTIIDIISGKTTKL